jgi:DNA end-binding protein Ku
LRFEDEVVQPTDIHADGKVTAAELSMAKTLVGQMTGKFAPDKFKDTYHTDLKRRVQEKIRNKETHSLDVEVPAPEQRPSAQVIDLTEALKASLARKRAGAHHRATAKKAGGRRRRA